MAANVTYIPPKAAKLEALRVAAYCRVSSDSSDQLHSYATQIKAYTEQIGAHADWELVDVYADEGLTGTRMDKREDFQRLLADCRKGKVDRVLCKSISRFARNTRDCLAALRELSALGVTVYFEKENIDTGTLTSELMVSVSGALAQQESISISQNQRMSYKRRMERGEFITCKAPFGYRLVEGKELEIIPEEAEIVKRIYREFLQGKSTNAIATTLTKEGIPTPGKKAVWQRATVESILQNEKCKGSALLQKSFTVDFLTKKTKVNEGEVPQYYVEDSHPAIIEPWEWEQVQAELERRKNSRTRHRQTSPFSGKILCADCGGIFGAKTWHSTDRYRRVIWQCNDKFKGEHKCETPHLTEKRLKELFLSALGAYLSDRETVIVRLRDTQRVLTDTDFIDEDIRTLEEELTAVTEMLRLCIEENAANATTEETYRATHAELCRRFEETEARLTSLQKQRDRMKADAIAIGGMMFELGELTALPLTFDEKLWNGTIDHVIVYADERVVFCFKDGKEIVTGL